MLKIGLIGVGHLGKIHLKLLQQSNKYELVGFYDQDRDNSLLIEEEFGCKYFSSLQQLIDSVEVVDIVTPTSTHFSIAKEVIKQGKHFFIEKPVTENIEEANQLIQLVENKNIKAQVGHVERFNPAFLVAKEHIQSPMFIETHRLATFNPRGTDVSVVLDLMIHDIDIILSVVKSDIKEIKSSGVAVVSDTPDIASARIEFQNGCVANITTSRISLKQMRKSRFFQKDAYISVDFLDKKTEIITINNSPNENSLTIEDSKGNKKGIEINFPAVLPNNAILDELESFAESILHDKTEAVTLHDAKRALEVAHEIINNFSK